MGRAWGNTLNQRRARASQPRKRLETWIKRTIKEFLEWHGWEVFRLQEGPFGERGVADLMPIREGRVMFLEIKTDSGKQSPAQKEFERRVKRAGGEYHVIRDVDDLLPLGVER